MLIFAPKLCEIFPFKFRIHCIRDAGEISPLSVEDHKKPKRGVFDPLSQSRGSGLPEKKFEKWIAVHTYINRDFNSHSWIRTLRLIVHIDLERRV